jgi:AcrR family transcriptional regulator
MTNSLLHIAVSDNLYLKDPTTTNIGKSILSEGLILLGEIGLEEFTFKKLASKIQTTESTIYRYFESKHQFLFYLFNFYWAWMEIGIVISITNIECPKERLKRIINKLTQVVVNDVRTPFIDESILQQVISFESSKTFLTKKVDEENKLGYFYQYKNLVDRISKIILEINPSYPYGNALITTIIESSFHQRFFGEHLPRLTNDLNNETKLNDFLMNLCFNTIENYGK